MAEHGSAPHSAPCRSQTSKAESSPPSAIGRWRFCSCLCFQNPLETSGRYRKGLIFSRHFHLLLSPENQPPSRCLRVDPGDQNHHLLLKIDTPTEKEGWAEMSLMRSSPAAAQGAASAQRH